ncbi:MAG: class I SAM-dependent methyltransferase [Candidatus Liptonbacteria bacterium]
MGFGPAKQKKTGAQKEIVLDLACGQGFFSRAFAGYGAQVIAVDISEELVNIAKTKDVRGIEYHVASADKLDFINERIINKTVIVLAVQNIENLHGVFGECARVLAPRGKIYIVLNHPCFRVPGASAWGYDEKEKIQYRRIDGYLSERREKIKMRPGAAPELHTISFHRPLQFYAKGLEKSGFAITRIEEWNSHKVSEPGPRAEAENRARKEIPLFMMIEATSREN